jgi:hypothetical protein
MASPRFSLGSSSVVTEGSEAAKSLCISEETVEFSCALPIPSQKTVSLCASRASAIRCISQREDRRNGLNGKSSGRSADFGLQYISRKSTESMKRAPSVVFGVILFAAGGYGMVERLLFLRGYQRAGLGSGAGLGPRKRLTRRLPGRFIAPVARVPRCCRRMQR